MGFGKFFAYNHIQTDTIIISSHGGCVVSPYIGCFIFDLFLGLFYT